MGRRRKINWGKEWDEFAKGVNKVGEAIQNRIDESTREQMRDFESLLNAKIQFAELDFCKQNQTDNAPKKIETNPDINSDEAKLKAYINGCFKRGIDHDTVISNLVKKRWPKEKVIKAINDLESGGLKCQYCGGSIDTEDTFCQHCGESVDKIEKGPVIVKISARVFKKPQICACCLGKAEKSFQITGQRNTGESHSELFPICEKCEKHIKWFYRWKQRIPEYYKEMSLPKEKAMDIIVEDYIHLRKSMSKNCTSLDEPVKYVSLYGSQHTLLFKNPVYASLFKKLNKDKIEWDAES